MRAETDESRERFDAFVDPLVRLLTDKAINQALQEVQQEATLASLRRKSEALEERREQELFEREAAELRRQREALMLLRDAETRSGLSLSLQVPLKCPFPLAERQKLKLKPQVNALPFVCGVQREATGSSLEKIRCRRGGLPPHRRDLSAQCGGGSRSGGCEAFAS